MAGRLLLPLLASLILFAAIAYPALRRSPDGRNFALAEVATALALTLGPWSLPVYVLFHALLISLCLPYAILLEAGAAYLFGFFRGVLCVFAAKILGASFSFWIGRTLFRNSSWAKKWVQSNKFFRVISEGVERDGWRFVLLARFSPVPSYVINYALAATNVRYSVDFLLPSILGCVPMILQNTSIGRLTKVATDSVVHGERTGILTYILPTMGVMSSILIAWRIKKYTSSNAIASNLQACNGSKAL